MPSSPDRPEFWVEDGPDDSWGPDAGWAAGDEVYGSQTTAWDAPRPTDDEPDVAATAPRRRLRWAALAAGLVVIAGIVTWQSRGDTGSADAKDTGTTSAVTSTNGPAMTTSRPTTERIPSSTTSSDSPDALLPTTTTRLPPLPLENATWELVGFGQDGLARYVPDTGRLITTPLGVFWINSENARMPSFATIAGAVLFHPSSSAVGYVVTDGQPAQQFAGWLTSSTIVLPSPDPGYVWAVLGSDATDPLGAAAVTAGPAETWRPTSKPDAGVAAQLVLVDAHGNYAGSFLDAPNIGSEGTAAYTMRPDGTGFALFDGVGGTYRVRPDGTRLVTHGQVLATGPAAMLLYECDDEGACGAVVADQRTAARRAVPGGPFPFSLTGFGSSGITSPDGTWAALRDSNRGALTLVNLVTGMMSEPAVGDEPVTDFGYGSNLTAFSPDNRYLLAAQQDGVLVIDLATGNPLGLLPVPSLDAIAVRATS